MSPADYRRGLLFMLQAGAEESERERRKRRGEVGEIHAHLWWAAISRPCNGALVVPASRKGERFQASVRASRVEVEFRAGWCYTGSQLGAGVCYNCGDASPTPSPSMCVCVCVCVCVWERESEMPAFQFSLLQLRLQSGVCCSAVGDTAFVSSPQLILHQRGDFGEDFGSFGL